MGRTDQLWYVAFLRCQLNLARLGCCLLISNIKRNTILCKWQNTHRTQPVISYNYPALTSQYSKQASYIQASHQTNLYPAIGSMAKTQNSIKLQKLQVLKNKFLGIILNITRYDRITDLHTEANVPSIEDYVGWIFLL